ncbi:small ribosomal subunit protein mS39 [Centruroides vittatus]|uniref:small ribosomal subunit protein mS39 n=1 Tax=Centruroides vittatus TaxID=120091 RepID=UPI00350F281B
MLNEDIIKEVKEAEAYSVLADETADISGTEQLSIGLRYFHEKNNEVQEVFVRFVEVKDLDAKSVAQTIDEFLTKEQLIPVKCVGLGFDGCSTMSGKEGGIVARLATLYIENKMATSNACVCWLQFLKRFPVRIVNKLGIQNTRRCSSLTTNKENNVAVSDDIIIPERIEREPTDILKALASTVGRDYTAPHYKYHDDPFLIPVSNVSKRTYALAKESGKKAARFFLEKYPDSFENNPAQPVIEAFIAPEKITEDTEVTEIMLINCIKQYEVNNSITVYNNLKRKGIEVSQESEQLLLELLCFYNGQEPPPEEYLESQWLQRKGDSETRRLWRQDNLADQIFNDMKEKDAKAYCAFIQGLCKYYQANRAYSLYEEMREKNLCPNVETYNSLISICPFLKENSEARWEMVKQLLFEMAEEGLMPNLYTMNAVLDVVSRFGRIQNAKSLSLEVLAEMKHLNIVPSLGTWYYMLTIFCKEKGPPSPILYEIMEYIEGKEFEICHPKDVYFFVTAMDVCCYHLVDKELAYRIHDLLQHGNNYILIGDSYKESIFYRLFFQLLCHTENIDILFENYNKYVPNIYTPEPSVMEELINAVNLGGEFHYLPQLWSDIITFNHADRERIVQSILSVMACTKQNEELQKQFITIAWDIKERIDSQDENRVNRIYWTGQMLDNIIEICLNGNDLAKVWEIMKKLEEKESEVIGIPRLQCLKYVCEAFLEAKSIEKAIFCLHYSLECGYGEIATYLKNNIDKYALTEEHKQILEKNLSATSLNREGNDDDDNLKI